MLFLADNPTEGTPFERSYWVVPNLLLAGHFPGSKDPALEKKKMRGLFECGIRRIFNLMEPDELDHDGEKFTDYAEVFRKIARKHEAEVDPLRFSIRDLSTPTPEFLTEILDRLDEGLNAGSPTYVHCWGGIGRTGTVIGTFLVRRGLATPENVLRVIETLRRNDPKSYRMSPETNAQRALVQSWQEGR